LSSAAQRRAGQSARERLLALLQPAQRRRAEDRGGYLDLLPGGELEPTGIAPALMHVGAVSRIYERWWRPAFGRVAKGAFGPSMDDEAQLAEQLMEVLPGDVVLDVACGPGNFSRRFARSVDPDGLVVGLDGSRVMLDRAARESERAGAANLAFLMADAEHMPFRKGSFDAVCCFAALNLFADPFSALDEMRRVLKPGGRIAIFTSCRPSSALLRGLESLATARTGLRMFEHHEVTGALRERGFVHIRQRITGLTQFVGGRLTADLRSD
jgi:ubiquinone/menaquinone biosynthesis C-methylase UbiE